MCVIKFFSGKRTCSFLLAAIMLLWVELAHANPEGWFVAEPPFTPPTVASSPEQACAHHGRPAEFKFIGAERDSEDGTDYICHYYLPDFGVYWVLRTFLVCDHDRNRVPRSPGVCVDLNMHKNVSQSNRPPVPPPCDPTSPDFEVGNPIRPISGEKVQVETDLTLVEGFALTRQYRSVRATRTNGYLGLLWSFSFERRLTRQGSPGNFSVTLAFGDGSTRAFKQQGNRFADQDSGATNLVLDAADGTAWHYQDQNGTVEVYKQVGNDIRLVSLAYANGRRFDLTYKSDGRLARIAGPSGRSLVFDMNPDGTVAAVHGPTYSVKYDYEPFKLAGIDTVKVGSQLSEVHFYDAQGNPVSGRKFAYVDEDGKRHLISDIIDEKGGQFAHYEYDADLRATLSEHAGGVERFRVDYSDPSSRTITDPLGTVRTFHLSDGQRGKAVTSIDQPAGSGCAASVSQASYDKSGISSVTDFTGAKTCYFRDPARWLETRRVEGVPAGTSCASVSSSVPAGARAISTKWHPDWYFPTVVAQPLKRVTVIYNGQPDTDGKILNCTPAPSLPGGLTPALVCKRIEQATSDANGAQGLGAPVVGPAVVQNFTYNERGQLMSQSIRRDEAGHVDTTTFTYYGDNTSEHAIGDLASVVGPTGHARHYLSYYAGGLPHEIEREDGSHAIYTFDEVDRIKSITIQADGQSRTTSYEYHEIGEIRHERRPDGTDIYFDYDDAHRLTSIRDGLGNQVRYVPDDAGNVVREEVYDKDGVLSRMTRRGFDALNRMQSLVVGGKLDQTIPASVMGYDAEGRLTQFSNELGIGTSIKPDLLGRPVLQIGPTRTKEATSPAVVQKFDLQDQLRGVTDPRHLSTTYDIDGLGHLHTLASPDTGLTGYTFDASGRVQTVKDARGVVATLGWDGLDRINSITYGNGPRLSYSYDQGRGGATGKLTLMTDDSGHTKFDFNGFGELKQVTQTVVTGNQSRSFSVGYAYGSGGPETGKLTEITYPSGMKLAYEYGNDGRVSRIKLFQPGSKQGQYLIRDIAYTPLGEALAWNWGDDAKSQPARYVREMDTAGRIVKYPLGDIDHGGVERILHIDAAGRIKQYEHRTRDGKPVSNLDQSFDYDDAARLTYFTATGTTQRFHYDDNGNRTRIDIGANGYTNVIDPKTNHLLSTTGPLPLRTNIYDLAGNLGSDARLNLAHGTRGLVTSAQFGKFTTGYLYNGFAQRVAKLSPTLRGGAEYAIYDQSGHLIAEHDGTGSVIAEYIYLDNTPIATRQLHDKDNGFDVYRVFSDQIDTPRRIENAINGKLVWSWEGADPFGVAGPTKSKEASTRFRFSLRFPGQAFDEETGLHYNWHRYYDPQLGRYVESDPLGLIAGINTYAYGASSPALKYDRLGLATWHGTLTFFGVSNIAGAGGMMVLFQMTSECVRGQKWVVEGDGVLGAVGIGKFPVSQTQSAATFVDGLDYVNPYVFNGLAKSYVILSGAMGPGGTAAGQIALGGAIADISGKQTGADFTILQAALGSSKVNGAITIQCGCK
ncbi:RHS repeat-associated core domain-containing protein [Massilia sp. TS11]|uniref:RHS repeat-associated core domain-containing protein n=1 Tax=Massilia sp. TS11 TaxID=2908003 RepID=UPI0027D9B8F0|nr:RHS repeat-associated core domain-containing protein [Massilia sp. TS11]